MGDREIDISMNIRGDNKHGHKVKVTIIIQWQRTDPYVVGATSAAVTESLLCNLFKYWASRMLRFLYHFTVI